MDRKLKTKERYWLMKRHRKERDGRIRDRIKAVLAYDDGYSYAEIARILLLDESTIRRHIEDYFEEKKLETTNGGSESKLSDEESAKLVSHLSGNTYLYVKDICEYVKSRFGKKYSTSGMTKWLKANNFCYKKAHGVPAKADKQKQQEFIKFYDELKAKTKGKEPIYFADSVHPQHQTHLTYGWILKGVRKEVKMTGKQKRLNFIGGICLSDHKILYKKPEKVNVDSIKAFLKKVRSNHPNTKKIHLIWDNAGYHTANEIKNYAKILSIELHYLPPYSPNLNPIERLWKIMHEQVSYNKYYEKFSEFTDATLEFFKKIGRRKKLLRSRISDNFQILGTVNPAS